ncbi:MAG: very short patch repair endonuclease [Steroidobacteraceae bacterium]
MRRVRQKNTSAELALRRELFARGLRYRIHVPVIDTPRRIADVAIKTLRVAVFVDGCFWHGCPIHATWPKGNAEFWRAKIVANQARDKDTNKRLCAAGWKILRVWAHEPPKQAANRITKSVAKLRARDRA